MRLHWKEGHLFTQRDRTDVHTQQTQWDTADPVGHNKRAGVCMPRTEATGEANPASTLTLDVQPPELGQKLLPVVEATNLQYFVPAAPADHARWDTRNYCHMSGVAEPGGRLHGRCFKAEHPA